MREADVTICIPVRNHGEFVGEAIQSALNQQGINIQVIVSDNASTDHTADVLASFKSEEKLLLLRQTELMPMTDHWNVFLDEIKSNWVIWLCADDVLLKGAVKKAFDFAVAQNLIGVFYDYHFLEDGVVKEKIPFFSHDGVINCEQQFKIFLRSNNWPLSGALLRTDLVKALNGFNTSYQFCPDWHMWLDLTGRFQDKKVGSLKGPFFYYRRHSMTATNECIRNLEPLDEIEKMKMSFIDKFLSADEVPDYVAHVRYHSLRLAQKYKEISDDVGLTEVSKKYDEYLTKNRKKLDPNFSRPLHSGGPYPLPEKSIRVTSG